MRLLLDTQIALWWLASDRRLNPVARESIASAASAVVSTASIWEVNLKHRVGKLPISPATFRDELRKGGFAILPIFEDHVFGSLDSIRGHDDPFDRLLLQVAIHERLDLLTADEPLANLKERHSALPILPLKDLVR